MDVENMTLTDAKNAVQHIKDIADDDEEAHCEEDDLRENILRYIAKHGKGKTAALTKIALSTKEIKFSRWCA